MAYKPYEKGKPLFLLIPIFSMTFQNYFTQLLCHAIGEIAYYRYMFPLSFFDTSKEFEGVNTHLLLFGKSPESDQLLRNMEGVDDAISRELLKTLVFGISIHPFKHAYIREMYAFQFSFGNGGNNSFKSASSSALFLNRLSSLLQAMEPLPVPIFLSIRMSLQTSSNNYGPPSFVAFQTEDIENYSIYPQCGSARVGKAEHGQSAMYMCALSVEGPIQTPPLGTIACSLPMSLNVDDCPHEKVFVASCGGNAASTTNSRNLLQMETESCECMLDQGDEETWTCPSCGRSCHYYCYGLKTGIAGTSCLTCCISNMDDLRFDPIVAKRLVHIRRLAYIILKEKPSGMVVDVIKRLDIKHDPKGRRVVIMLEKHGLVTLDRSSTPCRYRLRPGAKNGSFAQVWLGKDMRALWEYACGCKVK